MSHDNALGRRIQRTPSNGISTNATQYFFSQGRERDSVTGLQYNRARWFDGQVGRFASEDPIGLTGGINEFAYVENNPQNGVDPSGLFDIDVHYYLTFYLARFCFTNDEAQRIAEGDQNSDEADNKKPGAGYGVGVGPGGSIDYNDWKQQKQNIDFHAFGTREQNAKRANELYRNAVHSGDLFQLGTYLHFLQDEFSHFEFAGNPTTGQASKGNSVDHTNYDPEWTMDMAHATWDKIKQYARNRGCQCHGAPSDDDWATVREFADVGFDQSTKSGRFNDFTREVSPDQLKRKVDILNVPWRHPNGLR